MKLDKREAQYRPKIFQGRNRGCRQKQDRYRSRDRSHSRECGQYNNNNRGRRNYNNGNCNDRNYRSNYRDNSRSRNRGRNNTYDNRSNYRRDNNRQHYGNLGYRNRSAVENVIGPGPGIESNSRDNLRNRYYRDQSTGRDRGQRSRTVSRDRENRPRSRSSSCVSTQRDRSRCYRCNEYNHFARECPNAMSDEGSDQEDSATLQLLTQEAQMAALSYSEIDGLNM